MKPVCVANSQKSVHPIIHKGFILLNYFSFKGNIYCVCVQSHPSSMYEETDKWDYEEDKSMMIHSDKVMMSNCWQDIITLTITLWSVLLSVDDISDCVKTF